jgi:hypothetical protein
LHFLKAHEVNIWLNYDYFLEIYVHFCRIGTLDVTNPRPVMRNGSLSIVPDRANHKRLLLDAGPTSGLNWKRLSRIGSNCCSKEGTSSVVEAVGQRTRWA